LRFTLNALILPRNSKTLSNEMKKSIAFAVVALGAISASAQQAIEQPKFSDNWSIGLDGGVTTPITHHAFFGSMRGLVGLHVDKQITPAFALGVEGQFGVNTSSWKGYTHSSTAFDNSYVGTYGTVDLFNFFGGYNCGKRAFTIEALAGAGWGHTFLNSENGSDYNYFATKAGLNFNFNVSDKVTIALKPSVVWNMNHPGASQTAVAYNANGAAFNFQAGLTYHFGGSKFECVQPYNQAEIDALNGQINDLRAALDAASSRANAAESKANGLANELAACLNRPAQKEVVKEVNNNLNSVRYVFFRIGSSAITADQQPNVEMIANYLKNHKDAKVVIKGYASPDGPADINEKLAAARAEAVKTALVNKYKISSSRISAEGQGVGNMFSEESWNRVSICTIEEAK
jgi:outer membrane protein OmpA-like peptidoglycan-associated protein